MAIKMAPRDAIDTTYSESATKMQTRKEESNAKADDSFQLCQANQVVTLWQ